MIVYNAKDDVYNATQRYDRLQLTFWYLVYMEKKIVYNAKEGCRLCTRMVIYSAQEMQKNDRLQCTRMIVCYAKEWSSATRMFLAYAWGHDGSELVQLPLVPDSEIFPTQRYECHIFEQSMTYGPAMFK